MHSLLLRTFIAAFWVCSSSILASAKAGENHVHSILQAPERQIDFLELKLAVDSMIDPSFDIAKVRGEIDRILTSIRKALPASSNSMDKLHAIRRQLYVSGPWNDFRPFQYDHADPEGQSINGKILANYLVTRKGNCVSMPILMLILADHLGLDVSLSTAPLHVFMKFTDKETGRTYNVEATSGGGFSRDQWYQEKMRVTDEAIRNGIYLQKLSRRATALIIADLIGDNYFRKGLYDKALRHFNLSLELSPKNVHAMLKIGACYAKFFNQQFASRYKEIGDVPLRDRSKLHLYVEQNKRYFQMAESLGWQEAR